MTKKKLFVWTCDFSNTSGEGKLARLFIKNFNKNNDYKIILNQKNTLKEKYISTIFGIFYCWKKYLKNQKVCYLNYLPFWNFFIFIFLPPNTILGPITGGAKYLGFNLKNILIRGLIFPICYKISEFFLIFRNSKIIFSTDLLKKYLFLSTINKSEFNFVFKNFKLLNKKTKKIDFIIYHRKHPNKKSFFPYSFINFLVKSKYKIYVIGDKINLKSIKNLGYISNQKVLYFQSISKYTIASEENLYSFFILECLSNHVKILVSKNQKNINFKEKKFIKFNFKSFDSLKSIKKI